MRDNNELSYWANPARRRLSRRHVLAAVGAGWLLDPTEAGTAFIE